MKILTCISICFFLGACATPPAPVAVRVDPASVQLDGILSKAEKRVGPDTKPVPATYGEKTTVSFLGDAGILLGDAAKGLGPDWRFTVTGPQPRLPIYVQVAVKAVPLAAFLQEVAEQLGQRGDIHLTGKTIELRYRAAN